MSRTTIYDAIVGATTIRNCQSGSFDPGVNVDTRRASGQAVPSTFVANRVEPRINITTSDLAGAVTACGTAGTCLSSSTLQFAVEDRACSGNAGTGATIAAAQGYARINAISASGSNVATATVEAFITSTDGFTNPLTLNASASLSAESYVTEFRLASVFIDGTRLGDETDVTVNFGITEQMNPSNTTYPIAVFPKEINPTISITAKEVDVALAETIAAGTISSAVVYLKKDGVANATAEHISITFGSGLSVLSSIGGSGTDDATVQLMLHGTGLTISTTATVALS